MVACAVWGKQWQGKTARCLCNNAAVVAILCSDTSKHLLAMHLMRCLSFYSASYQLILAAEHLPCLLNTAADHLSRDGLPCIFCSWYRPPIIPPPFQSCSCRLSCTRNGIGHPRVGGGSMFYFANGLAASSQKTYKLARTGISSTAQ